MNDKFDQTLLKTVQYASLINLATTKLHTLLHVSQMKYISPQEGDFNIPTDESLV